jgi:uncharacterized protein YhaN
MDDVLVNFDDRRAEATVRTLAELAREVQIVFLTCHRATTDRMQRLLPECRVQEIAPREIRQA